MCIIQMGSPAPFLSYSYPYDFLSVGLFICLWMSQPLYPSFVRTHTPPPPTTKQPFFGHPEDANTGKSVALGM